MTKKQLYTIAFSLTALSVVTLLGCLWWWALLGMSAKIGEAWVWTIAITFVIGCIFGVAGDNKKND